jgi:uncharacterized protein involved in exopolysaccharide biosynthesis
MKRATRLLIRLYPATWRARYGDEFEALVEDSSPNWIAIFDLLKGAIRMQLSVPSFPKLALMLSIAGLLIGLLISFMFPRIYVSQAEMMLAGSVTSTGLPPPLLEYLVASENEVLSKASLSEIIQNPGLDLYPEERTKFLIEDVVETMRRNIRIVVGKSGSIGQNRLSFRVEFAYRDPVKAQKTVQALIVRFSDANQKAAGTRSSAQSDSLEARIALLEKRLGIPPPPPAPGDQFASAMPGLNLDVLNPPSLPVRAARPNRYTFMSFGFGAGLVAALVIAVFRRRLPPIPFPAQTA